MCVFLRVFLCVFLGVFVFVCLFVCVCMCVCLCSRARLIRKSHTISKNLTDFSPTNGADRDITFYIFFLNIQTSRTKIAFIRSREIGINIHQTKSTRYILLRKYFNSNIFFVFSNIQLAI